MSDRVHQSHCCVRHGCKYGSKDCPVETGMLVQDYDCEECGFDREERKQLVEMLRCELKVFSNTNDINVETTTKFIDWLSKRF